MAPLLDVILNHVPPPPVSVQDPFAMCVAMIERDAFVGRVATGGCTRSMVESSDNSTRAVAISCHDSLPNAETACTLCCYVL